MKKNAQMCFEYMKELFGDDPKCELNYKTDIDLLVAVILSAQCTDKRVNTVTRELFEKYKTVSDYANADLGQLEREIHSCGFFRSKSANIVNMAKAVVNEHGGVIPSDMNKLVKLAGVGRKTANVFLAEFYKIPAIAVDTHVTRVSRRLGFSNGKTPDMIERDLMRIFDKKDWYKYHKYLVLFGRYYCKALKPQCGGCKIAGICTAKQFPKP